MVDIAGDNETAEDDAEAAGRAVEAARKAIGSRNTDAARSAIRNLTSHLKAITPIEAVDLLERASVYGPPELVGEVWDLFDGDFSYTGWALALALRCAQEDVARELLARGVDLLGEPRRPSKWRALMPHEGAFTRFDLTRESPTLFLNNMDHTVSTEVFEDFTGTEQLVGKPYGIPTRLDATCRCVLNLARDGLFDTVIFDDLFRATMVRAWYALRHPKDRDERAAHYCLSLGQEMLVLHRQRHMGDANIELMLANLIVPRVDRAIVAFVCENAPKVFLGRLVAADWLKQDGDLLREMLPHLSAGTSEQNAELLCIVAGKGWMDQLQRVAGWPGALDDAQAAIQAASQAGHAEAATWLLARYQRVPEVGANQKTPQVKVRKDPSRIAKPAERTHSNPVMGAAAKEDDEASPRDVLACQVVGLARSLVIADNPFLASSLSRLADVSVRQNAPLATDGRYLLIDTERVLDDFSVSRLAPTRDLAHVLVHCLLLHPFVGKGIDQRSWNLASDMIAESLAGELVGPRDGERGRREAAALEQAREACGGKLATERLYHELHEGSLQGLKDVWEPLFLADDHERWYPQQPADAGENGDMKAPAASSAGDSDIAASKKRDSAMLDASQRQTSTGADTGSGAEPDEGPDAEPAGVRPDKASDRGFPGEEGHASPRERSLEDAWRREAARARVDLETLSRSCGNRLGSLIEQLEVSSHKQVDYREFLRQFAVQSEEMHLSEDEFDYVFYTYGLSLYHDMPLIEPLEWRSERRIRDFVIVIDTSSSVTAKVVQQFVDATYDVLASESSFFAKTNIHIIQADLKVQSDVKITSVGDLDRWRHNISLRGFGGTDFRPAFRYVDELLAAGEFDDLSGLIYFTDGWGIYPKRMPPYKTTFVFYDEDHRPELVPTWAMQITLHPGEFESMSVY